METDERGGIERNTDHRFPLQKCFQLYFWKHCRPTFKMHSTSLFNASFLTWEKFVKHIFISCYLHVLCENRCQQTNTFNSFLPLNVWMFCFDNIYIVNCLCQGHLCANSMCVYTKIGCICIKESFFTIFTYNIKRVVDKLRNPFLLPLLIQTSQFLTIHQPCLRHLQPTDTDREDNCLSLSSKDLYDRPIP